MPLDAASQFVNDLVAGGRGEHPAPQDHLALREAWGAMFAALPPTVLANERRDLDVAGCPAILLTPPSKPTALLIWFHGGGWVIGSPELSLPETDRLATQAETVVLSLDYRMAPEHQFPAAYDDSVAAVAWAIEHAAELGIDPTKISVGGDSAGGNLAAAVAQHYGPQLRGQLLVYPAVDAARQSAASELYAEGYLLNTPTMSWFSDQYLGTQDRTDVRCSPLRASDDVMATLAPAHVVIAEYDPLRDDGFDYAERMRQAGVTVTVDHHADQMHGFFSLPAVLPGAERAIATAAEFLKSL
jgi:acetyl esterase